jgi:hypothetical protein
LFLQRIQNLKQARARATDFSALQSRALQGIGTGNSCSIAVKYDTKPRLTGATGLAFACSGNHVAGRQFFQRMIALHEAFATGGLAAGTFDEAGFRRVKQLGVDYVLIGGPPLPWTEMLLRERMEKAKAAGLTVGNMMMGGFSKHHLWQMRGGATITSFDYERKGFAAARKQRQAFARRDVEQRHLLPQGSGAGG